MPAAVAFMSKRRAISLPKKIFGRKEANFIWHCSTRDEKNASHAQHFRGKDIEF